GSRNWTTGGTIFDERLQPVNRRIPLRADLLEVPFRRLQAPAIQLPEPLTPPARMAHQARRAEGVEVLRNRLPPDAAAAAAPRNRERPVRGPASQQPQPDAVPQRDEHRHRVAGLRSRRAAAR